MPNSRAVVTPSLPHLPSFGSQVMQVVGSLLLESCQEETDQRPDNQTCVWPRARSNALIAFSGSQPSISTMYLHRLCIFYVRSGQIPADEVASPVEAVRAVHPDEAILRSFDCPGVTLLLRGEVFSKIPVELANYPLTGHHPSLGENFYMFHPLTLQLLGRIVPEQRNAKDCLQHHYILVCIGQVNNQRDGGTCGYKV